MLTSLIQELEDKGEITFFVKVRPGASVTSVKEILDDGYIKIDVAAVPEGGNANAELIKFLAEEFRVSRSNVEIVSGKSAREKLVRVSR